MTDTLFTVQSEGKFSGGGFEFRCALGKGGVIGAAHKREGDGASPLGVWRMKRLFYRSDRMTRPETGLPAVSLKAHDGWCDDPAHRLYNRPVTLPFQASHEKLWREDHVYDLIVELSHNDDPIVPERGSAVFFHLARLNYEPTEGCVAIAQEDMLAILQICSDESRLEIKI